MENTFENIITDRLTIRLALPNDADAIYAYRSDKIENRYQGWFPESSDEVRDYITQMPRTPDAADTCFQFVIINTENNHIIGDMGIVFTGHGNAQAEIGCTLDKKFQRKGYATEALTAMVGYLFIKLNKHRIIASVDPRNKPSIQLIKRLGFRKEAHHIKSYYLRGEWVDDIIYAMLETEWK